MRGFKYLLNKREEVDVGRTSSIIQGGRQLTSIVRGSKGAMMGIIGAGDGFNWRVRRPWFAKVGFVSNTVDRD